MAEEDDKPTADEVDEVELEAARGGVEGEGRLAAGEDQGRGRFMAEDEAKSLPLASEDPQSKS